MTKMVFDYSGYKNVAKINTGLGYEKELETKVKEFANLYSFEIINMEGSPELLENCYFKVKKALKDKRTHSEDTEQETKNQKPNKNDNYSYSLNKLHFYIPHNIEHIQLMHSYKPISQNSVSYNSIYYILLPSFSFSYPFFFLSFFLSCLFTSYFLFYTPLSYSSLYHFFPAVCKRL